MDHWPIWVIGVILVVAAGLWSVLAVRNRSRRDARRAAEHGARAAIAAAEVSRDACPTDLPEATRLLDRATLTLGGSAGADAARRATELAESADRLWRSASSGRAAGHSDG